MTACVVGLIVMATWTVAIKYLVPVLYFVSERAAGRDPGGIPVMWDFWWVAHLALAWMLAKRHTWAWAAGMSVGVVEVSIVAVKLAFFFARPEFSFWKLLWFTNKIYVIVFFLFLVAFLLTPAGRAALGRRAAVSERETVEARRTRSPEEEPA